MDKRLSAIHHGNMKICVNLAIFVLLTSCSQTNSKSDKNVVADMDSLVNSTESSTSINDTLTDHTITFLSHDANNSIVINDEFCKTITNPEKAALGYIATFIGNDCYWDGEYTSDRSNLSCKILTALNLGYQCSDKHLGFLRQMFKNDTKVLEELASDNCPTTPYGATIQNTFNEITLTVKGSEILVFFKVSGINLREGESWSWTETDHFKIEQDNIRLIKKDESTVKRVKFDTGE